MFTFLNKPLYVKVCDLRLIKTGQPIFPHDFAFLSMPCEGGYVFLNVTTFFLGVHDIGPIHFNHCQKSMIITVTIEKWPLIAIEWILEGQPLEMIEWVFSGSPPLVKRSIGNEPLLRSTTLYAMQYSWVYDSWKWLGDLENVLNIRNRKSVTDLLPHFYLMYSQPVPERFFRGMQSQCYNGILLGRHFWLLLTIPFFNIVCGGRSVGTPRQWHKVF